MPRAVPDRRRLPFPPPLQERKWVGFGGANPLPPPRPDRPCYRLSNGQATELRRLHTVSMVREWPLRRLVRRGGLSLSLSRAPFQKSVDSGLRLIERVSLLDPSVQGPGRAVS